MKKKLVILSLIGLLLMPTILLAQVTPEVPPAVSQLPTTKVALVTLIDNIAKWIYAIVFALAIIFILVSAFQFLTAAGNPEKITSARQILIYALVAVAVAVVAWGLPKLIHALIIIPVTP